MSEPILPPDTASPDAGTGGGQGALYRAALGPLNAERYLRVFADFDAAGRRRLVWHGPAALFTVGWLVLRRLWTGLLVYTLLLAGVLSLVWLAWPQLATWPPGVRHGVLGALLLCWFLWPGWLAYAVLHGQVQRRILRAVASARNLAEARALLQPGGADPDRLRRVVTGLGLLLSGLLFLGAWQPWMPPAREPVMAQVARPSHAEPVVPAPVPRSAPAASPAAPAPPVPLPIPVPAVVGMGTASPAPAFGINVGLFANPDNAQRAHERLLQAQLPATVEVLRGDGSERFRVRVGPFADAATAAEMARKVRSLGLEAVVFEAR